MPDLSSTFCSIPSPNPFWLASGPPTNTAGQVRRAFEAGWGGAVWKTITDQPVANVCSRYAALDADRRKAFGLNNIELISDRPLEDNLREIAAVKKAWPKNPLLVSLMTASTPEAWHELVKRAQDTGADGLELNFGCPHGMNERGMGSVVGQVPEYTRMITAWAKEAARVPVMVKLTPNVSDIVPIAEAARDGGADAISLINTVNSLMGVDLNTLSPQPVVDGCSTHGGFCGPAIKPIALHFVSAVASHPATRQVPLSGIGGVSNWRDAAEFLLLGAANVQVCTAVMHHGFRIIEAFKAGLEDWMREHGFARIGEVVGKSLPRLKRWGELNLNYKSVAHIKQETCIHCGICYTACEDGCYQAIRWQRVPFDEYLSEENAETENAECGMRNAELKTQNSKLKTQNFSRSPAHPLTRSPDPEDVIDIYTIKEDACVGCNMCSLICPVAGCITMRAIETGKPPVSWDERQGTQPAPQS